MEYQTYPPTPDLAPFVKCFWTLKVPKEAPRERQQILPDGCTEICFVFKDDIKRYTVHDQFIIQPRSFVMGQISVPFYIEPTGEVDSLGVRFYPSGLHYFIDEPIHHLSNKETPLGELFDPEMSKQLEIDVHRAHNIQLRMKIIEDFLLKALQQNVDVDVLVANTLDTMLATKGSIGVNKILAANTNKRRQLERKFSNLIGVSPKRLCRIIRLQSSLKMILDAEEKDLAKIGYDHEYFDQSHFIKDFKDFTGVSPGEFYQDETFLLSSMIYSKD